MKKYVILVLFCLFLTPSLFAMSHHRHHRPGNNPGGSGVPEPASLMLILAGGAAAYGITRAVKK